MIGNTGRGTAPRCTAQEPDEARDADPVRLAGRFDSCPSHCVPARRVTASVDTLLNSVVAAGHAASTSSTGKFSQCS